jgi:cytochrome c2
MLRTWVIAGFAVAASTGPTLGQDAAAGEQVFKRLCSPCHEIGQDAKIKLGPPLNGIDGRKSGTFEGFNYSPANKSSGITCQQIFWHHLERGNFPQIYPRADARNAGNAHGICRHQERQGHRRSLGLSQAVRA